MIFRLSLLKHNIFVCLLPPSNEKKKYRNCCPSPHSFRHFVVRIRTMHSNTRIRNGDVIKNNLSFGYVGIFLVASLCYAPIFQTLATQFNRVAELNSYSQHGEFSGFVWFAVARYLGATANCAKTING